MVFIYFLRRAVNILGFVGQQANARILCRHLYSDLKIWKPFLACGPYKSRWQARLRLLTPLYGHRSHGVASALENWLQ